MGVGVRLMSSGRSYKNDPNDARSIAIAAQRSDRFAIVTPDDQVRVLRLLVTRHRDMARLRSTHASRLHALLGEHACGWYRHEGRCDEASRLLDGVAATRSTGSADPWDMCRPSWGMFR